uniref:FAD-binding PCMH-type domain-containing protein n=1 Tax=Chromera velia CCMP2878 TaxID=1169474 RepID=A0A0G4FSY9_9ALVE|mmetsp:Transcript_26403/g.51893  ORF Transcript_26403/g.51893 Transcript_26403/m.51893 type:complete len:356 (-) Transcript_26403:169-1236(-)|eukprot:Cvel_18529.t1-p1 / transcript=Cvel_18529.t1 / gene=Cvel_18529 / organism=Chromera_velia_CCMP2878 / gene_product=hypothetical protein / transcript_product=hypothetical protein / location=Cvel_scaffold1540:41184-42248(-) / protein_length=355 / sequence_SO=supercontig / SO=protein_coding / is_pseudo=false
MFLCSQSESVENSRTGTVQGIGSASALPSKSMETVVRECLAKFKGDMHLPGSAGFIEALKEATAANFANSARCPALILCPDCTQDVVLALRAVRRAREQRLLGDTAVSVCGGGHSRLCVVDGAVLLQMRRMRDVSFSSDVGGVGVVTLGAGARMGEVLECAEKHGTAVPVGTWAGVGVGLMLTGGVGHLTRSHSVCVDNLVEVEIVTPGGEVLRLPSDSGAPGAPFDLWWACRGSAANFGVVTRVSVRAFPVGPVLFAQRVVPVESSDNWGAAVSRLVFIEDTVRALPESQHCDMAFGYTENGEGVMGVQPVSIHGEPFTSEACETLGVEPLDFSVCKFKDIPFGGVCSPASSSW